MFGLAWDYFVTPEHFEIRVFCFLPVYRLKLNNVVAVHPIDGMFNLAAIGKLGGHPWNTVSLGNRWKRRWILLEKRSWPRFLAITPKHPSDFAQLLGSSISN
jgi:hypothetical protein